MSGQRIPYEKMLAHQVGRDIEEMLVSDKPPVRAEDLPPPDRNGERSDDDLGVLPAEEQKRLLTKADAVVAALGRPLTPQEVVARADEILRDLPAPEYPTQEVIDRNGAAFMERVKAARPLVKHVRVVPAAQTTLTPGTSIEEAPKVKP
jgi:hypothetical protein